MKPMVVADLDSMARKAIVSGSLENLSMDIHVTPKCHPNSGMKTTRAYEGNTFMLTCSICNLFVCNLKIAEE